MTDLANAHFKPLRRKTSTRAALSFIGLQLPGQTSVKSTRRRSVRAIAEVAAVNRRASKACAPTAARGTRWFVGCRNPGCHLSKARARLEAATILRGITGPPPDERDLKVDAGDSLYRVDHLEHGKTPAVAAIERDRLAAAAQVRERIA